MLGRFLTRAQVALDDLFGSSTVSNWVTSSGSAASAFDVAWHRDVDHEDRRLTPAFQHLSTVPQGLVPVDGRRDHDGVGSRVRKGGSR